MKFFTSSGKALAFSGVDLPDDFTGIEAVYPALLNEYHLSLIDWENFQNDPPQESPFRSWSYMGTGSVSLTF